MYFVPQPTETARLIQTLLAKDSNSLSQERDLSRESESREKNIPASVSPDEVGYDVRNTVRDVLR
jgi:hypothetical protein